MSGSESTAYGFDVGALDAHLKGHIGGLEGAPQLQPISGGQSNPTFFVTYANRALVLRKQPPGELLPSAHAVDREFRIMRALADTPVPVPPALLLCEDKSVIGTLFYVMDKVEGRVFHDCTLPGVSPAERGAMYAAMAQTLAALHNVDFTAAGLADFGRPGNYFGRQIARWTRQWELSKTREDANIDRLVAWLPAHVPADDHHPHRPWRLSHGQSHVPSHPPRGGGGAGLGIVHPRPSAGGPCPLRHGLGIAP